LTFSDGLCENVPQVICNSLLYLSLAFRNK
jgi:hypothetical protein